jgi:anti-sigma28 factor (negative regulator of flagellin synthesis)
MITESGRDSAKNTQAENDKIETTLQRNLMIIYTPFAPEFDIQRVDALRTQIADDAYVVDTQQIADKVIDLEMALVEAS